MSLTALYTSPTTSHTLSSPLPALPTTISTQTRTAYLTTLQTSLRDLQKDINSFLTQKMEDDKAGDAKDEETYGEEVVDED